MADQARLQWSCVHCRQCFSTQGEFRNHIETEKLRVGDLIEKLQIAFLHSTSTYSTHIVENSHHDTADDSGNASGDQSSKRDDLCESPSDDQSSTCDLLRCPFPGCNGEETYTKRANMFRHYQTRMIFPFVSKVDVKLIGTSDIECDETCAFCNRTFNRLRKLAKHLEDCKVKKSRDEQGIFPNLMQSLALRRKDQLCKSVLKQMNQKMGSKKRRKGRKKSARKEIGPHVGYDDSSGEECPVTPTQQISPVQTQLSVRKRQRTGDGQHPPSSGDCHGSSPNFNMLLAATQSNARGPVSENGDVEQVYPAMASARAKDWLYRPAYESQSRDQVVSQYGVAVHAGVPPAFYHTLNETPSYTMPYNSVSDNYTNLNFDRSMESPQTLFVS
ncbi:MAG: hypothetical protein M1840_002660 [Geoglossum simile]|nr:MAG: hypothetical protein M1840_002660 [Geoglossum simile]